MSLLTETCNSIGSHRTNYDLDLVHSALKFLSLSLASQSPTKTLIILITATKQKDIAGDKHQGYIKWQTTTMMMNSSKTYSTYTFLLVLFAFLFILFFSFFTLESLEADILFFAVVVTKNQQHDLQYLHNQHLLPPKWNHRLIYPKNMKIQL